jgi:hypothetical protein
VLGDAVNATAVLDRLIHHRSVINIRAESYRLRETKRAGWAPPRSPLSRRGERGEIPPPKGNPTRVWVNSQLVPVGQRHAAVNT